MAEKKPIRRVYRSRDERILAGVGGGFAEYFGVDPTIVRLLLIVGLVMGTGPLAPFVYVLLIFVIPLEPEIREPQAPADGSSDSTSRSGLAQQ